MATWVGGKFSPDRFNPNKFNTGVMIDITAPGGGGTGGRPSWLPVRHYVYPSTVVNDS